MVIDGYDYKFKRTPYAQAEIAAMCPGRNIQNLSQVIAGDDTFATLDGVAKIVAILSRAYERAEAWENPTHEVHTLTAERILDLEQEAYEQVVSEAFGAFAADGEQQINAKPIKKKTK